MTEPQKSKDIKIKDGVTPELNPEEDIQEIQEHHEGSQLLTEELPAGGLTQESFQHSKKPLQKNLEEE